MALNMQAKVNVRQSPYMFLPSIMKQSISETEVETSSQIAVTSNFGVTAGCCRMSFLQATTTNCQGSIQNKMILVEVRTNGA